MLLECPIYDDNTSNWSFDYRNYAKSLVLMVSKQGFDVLCVDWLAKIIALS